MASEAVECDRLLLCFPASGRALAWFWWGGSWSVLNAGRCSSERRFADGALARLEAWFELGGPRLGLELPPGWSVARVFRSGLFDLEL